MVKILRFCVILLVLAAGLALHLVNDQAVRLDYYLGSVELPFSFMLAAALAVGAACGLLAALPMLLGLKRENHLLHKRLGLSEQALEASHPPALKGAA